MFFLLNYKCVTDCYMAAVFRFNITSSHQWSCCGRSCGGHKFRIDSERLTNIKFDTDLCFPSRYKNILTPRGTQWSTEEPCLFLALKHYLSSYFRTLEGFWTLNLPFCRLYARQHCPFLQPPLGDDVLVRFYPDVLVFAVAVVARSVACAHGSAPFEIQWTPLNRDRF